MRQLKQVGGFELGVQNIEEHCVCGYRVTTGGVTLSLPNTCLSNLTPTQHNELLGSTVHVLLC